MEARAPELLDLSRFHTFAVWMIGDRARALARAVSVVQAAPDGGLAEWAMALLAPMARTKEKQGDRRALLAALDELLRTDLTITPGDHPQIQRDPRRLRVLQWELKRSCLFAVMRGVQPHPRAAFVLHRILGLSREEIAALFRITLNAVNINLGRAEKVLGDYLGARCQHVAPGNSCRCETRLGIALERGFVGWPEHRDSFPDAAVYSGKATEVGPLYASLPPFTFEQEPLDTLIKAQRGHARAE
jgi:DNA-directed RNA polymerase specialized sigma24 family protein